MASGHTPSTTLALACAAFRLSSHFRGTDRALADRLLDEALDYASELGGFGAGEPAVAAQRDALEAPRPSPQARAEAVEAIKARYGDLGLPRIVWIVGVLGHPASFVAPVDLGDVYV